ncbi:MAG: 4'-phosphopantetheinyl transferase superfamily protein [Bacilli bacterium]|nr:4'-phosphopantetheinyl transferase superfamily protein [Bacilli bacterium]
MSEFEEGIIQGALPLFDRLLDYGFHSENDSYVHEFPIQGGTFSLHVSIDFDGTMDTRLIDNETGDEYNLYKMPSAHGEYLISIRDEVKERLKDICERCYSLLPHVGKEFGLLMDHFLSHHGEGIEYLWDDENGIIRRKDNRKWYAVFMKVPYEKVGEPKEGVCSIVAFRGNPEDVDMKTVFPGYHLNKKSWVCMILDGRNDPDDLLRRLERSRALALGKGKKNQPCLYLVRLFDALPEAKRLFDVLSGERKEKALRYVRLEDKTRSAVGTLLIRKATGGKPISLIASGKPYVEGGPCFSLSHGGDYIGLYAAPYEVGLDIEEIARCSMGTVPHAFTEEEAKEVTDKESFAKAWTTKEALAKCEGEGILTPTKVGFSRFADGKCVYKGKSYFIQTTVLEGHVMTLCNERKASFPEPITLSIADLLEE